MGEEESASFKVAVRRTHNARDYAVNTVEEPSNASLGKEEEKVLKNRVTFGIKCSKSSQCHS